MNCVPLENKDVNILCEIDTISSAVRWCLAFLGAVRPLCHKPAIVLDIDGTVLLNEEDGTKCVLGFTRLCKACETSGISIFCVTARPDSERGSNRKWTVGQLAKCGIGPIRKLYMRPPRASYEKYKYECRQSIRARGYQILLSVGDQFADLAKKSRFGISDSKILIGTLGDDGTFAVKLPTEFQR